MAERRSHVRQIKGALLLIGILVFGSVVALFVIHQHKRQSGQSGDASIIQNKAAISLKGVRHTAIKGGVKEWSLQAESADYRLEDSEAVFKTLHVTFFRDKNDDVILSAPLGTWHTDSNDLDVSGHVMIKNKQYELQTEKLTYIHERRMCVTNSPVTIISKTFKITADNMRYDLAKNIFRLNGNVVGIINENIGL